MFVVEDVYYTPVMCFLLFNFFDFVGRMLPGLIQWVKILLSVHFMVFFILTMNFLLVAKV